MGKFNDRLMTEFWPSENGDWVEIHIHYKRYPADEPKTLKGVGVKVQRDTNKTESIVVSKGFETDLASKSERHGSDWFVDVARAAIIRDRYTKLLDSIDGK